MHAQSPPSSGLGSWFWTSDPEWQDQAGAAVIKVYAGSVTVVGSSVSMFSNDVCDGKVKLLKIRFSDINFGSSEVMFALLKS